MAHFILKITYNPVTFGPVTFDHVGLYVKATMCSKVGHVRSCYLDHIKMKYRVAQKTFDSLV